MKILIDTRAFLWLLTGDDRLSERAREVFLDTKHKIYLSAASLWEITIKISLGKLKLKKAWMETIQKEMKRNLIIWLPIEMPHCEQVTKLPFYHRDPFDRMLIAQAMVEGMHVLTNDTDFSEYSIKSIW
jgi:PIN domain nuclease of toxin-antitoxin system